MKLKVVAVRDRAVDAFNQPFFVPSIGQANRLFADEVNRKDDKNMLNTHPEDFDLYELGEFDSGSGEFVCFSPRMVAIGKDVVRGE